MPPARPNTRRTLDDRHPDAQPDARPRGIDARRFWLRALFPRRPGAAARRAALPCLRRYRAHLRPLSHGEMASARRQDHRDHGLVLQRLPRHGPAQGGGGRHDRDRRPLRRRCRRHPQHRGQQLAAGRSRAGTRRPARQGGRPRLHLGLRLEPGGHLDHRQADPGLPDPVRRLQPQLDDRGRAPFRLREEDLPPQRPPAPRGAAAARPATGPS